MHGTHVYLYIFVVKCSYVSWITVITNWELQASETQSHTHMLAGGTCTYAHSNVQTTVSPVIVTMCHNLPTASRICSSSCIWNGACWDYRVYISARLDSKRIQTHHSFYNSNRRGAKKRHETVNTELVKQGRLDRREQRGERSLQRRAGNAVIIVQMWCKFQFLLIPHFAGNETLNQGRDNMREGNKWKTSEEDESNQNRANDTERALSSKHGPRPFSLTNSLLLPIPIFLFSCNVDSPMPKGTIIGLGHSGLKINSINMWNNPCIFSLWFRLSTITSVFYTAVLWIQGGKALHVCRDIK